MPDHTKQTIQGYQVGKILIQDLVVEAILGVYDPERITPRSVVINLELGVNLAPAGISDDLADCLDYAKVCTEVSDLAQKAKRFTVEALAADIAEQLLRNPLVNRVCVRVEKPGAVPGCRSVGVEIERCQTQATQ